MPQPSDLQAAVLALGGRLLDLMEAAPEPALFSRKGGFKKLMEWSMRDLDFKVRLFRFVDVAPALGSPADLRAEVPSFHDYGPTDSMISDVGAAS